MGNYSISGRKKQKNLDKYFIIGILLLLLLAIVLGFYVESQRISDTDAAVMEIDTVLGAYIDKLEEIEEEWGGQND